MFGKIAKNFCKLKAPASRAATAERQISSLLATGQHGQAFQVLAQSYLEGTVLDVFTFRDLALAYTKEDVSWSEVLFKLYSRDFKACQAIKPLLERLNISHTVPPETKQARPTGRQDSAKELEDSLVQQLQGFRLVRIGRIVLHDVVITGRIEAEAEAESDQSQQSQEEYSEYSGEEELSLLEALGIGRVKIGRIDIEDLERKE